MNEENKKLPAYPVKSDCEHFEGLTKLEAFTMAAMQGMASKSFIDGTKAVSNEAVSLAIATLEALEKAR